MSDDRHTSAICPGQQALFDNKGDDHYLRLVLTAYWSDSSPSCEIFYITHYPIKLNPRSIAALEQSISDTLAANAGKTPVRVIYNSFSGIEMSPDDVATAGFRVITGAATPMTAPVVTDPTTGAPVAVDPTTGLPIVVVPVVVADPTTDPVTGLPIDPTIADPNAAPPPIVVVTPDDDPNDPMGGMGTPDPVVVPSSVDPTADPTFDPTFDPTVDPNPNADPTVDSTDDSDVIDSSTSDPQSRADMMIDFTDSKDGDDTQPKASDPSF